MTLPMTIRFVLPATLLLLSLSTPTLAGQDTLTGLDVLRQSGFETLRGQRVGLITNHTAIDRDGNHAVKLFTQASGFELVALFSPEHGFEGTLDREGIAHGRDAGSGLPIFSLYGETRQPTPDMLGGIDTLVFDIQDIGTRFYTYISTMGLAMQAAAEQGLRFVVLDRPNPINGRDFGGPVADEAQLSFVAFHPLPTRHGMTTGELATLFAAELGLDLELEVVRLEGWRREAFFDATGLRWVNPSPNMRSLIQALLYPGIGLLETTNLSVGRGTDTPFERIGAPWLDGAALARKLNRLDLPGVAFVPIRFTPDASTFEGETCGGVSILVTDRAEFDPVRLGFEIAHRLRADHPDQWEIERYPRLLADDAALAAVRDGAGWPQIEAVYAEELAAFGIRRRAFLLYD